MYHFTKFQALNSVAIGHSSFTVRLPGPNRNAVPEGMEEDDGGAMDTDAPMDLDAELKRQGY